MKNLLFIGLRGSGKSTVGKALATTLKRPFWDTDSLVEIQYASTIAKIVSLYGWEKFRTLESEILHQVCSKKKQVIATGGGIVLKEANRQLLATCTVFYLQAPLHLLFDRLTRSPQVSRRPPLYQTDARRELEISLKEREHLYLSVADHVLDARQKINALLSDIFDLCPNLASEKTVSSH